MEGFVKLSELKNMCWVQDINLRREISMPFQKIWAFGNLITSNLYLHQNQFRDFFLIFSIHIDIRYHLK